MRSTRSHSNAAIRMQSRIFCTIDNGVIPSGADGEGPRIGPSNA